MGPAHPPCTRDSRGVPRTALNAVKVGRAYPRFIAAKRAQSARLRQRLAAWHLLDGGDGRDEPRARLDASRSDLDGERWGRGDGVGFRRESKGRQPDATHRPWRPPLGDPENATATTTSPIRAVAVTRGRRRSLSPPTTRTDYAKTAEIGTYQGEFP